MVEGVGGLLDFLKGTGLWRSGWGVMVVELAVRLKGGNRQKNRYSKLACKNIQHIARLVSLGFKLRTHTKTASV